MGRNVVPYQHPSEPAEDLRDAGMMDDFLPVLPA